MKRQSMTIGIKLKLKGMVMMASRMITPNIACVLVATLFTIATSNLQTANAQIIEIGDLIASDFSSGMIYKIDPVSGEQSELASGGHLVNPGGIAIEDTGTILVAERSTLSIIRIDLPNNTQTVVTSGGSFVNIVDVELEADGSILVTDPGANAIFRVDPVTGNQSTVTSGDNLNGLLRGVAVESSGDLVTLNNSVVRVNSISGVQVVLASGSDFQASANIAIESNDNILVVDRSAFALLGGIIRVDPITGAQSVVSSGGNFVDPFGIAVESNGQILVSDYTTNSVLRVDPVTGAQSLLSDGGLIQDPLDIEVAHVSVIGMSGDVNQDGEVNLLDVGPFISVLAAGTYQAEADINSDGIVNLLDVDPFIALLAG